MASKVDEMLDIVGEVILGFHKRKLEAFCTPDVVEKLAVSLFMEAHPKQWGGRPGGNGKVVKGDFSEGKEELVEGEVDEKQIRKTQTGKKTYDIKVDGQWYSTFNKEAYGGRFQAIEEGDTVAVRFKRKGNFRNIVSVESDGSGDNPNEQGEDDIPF